MSKYSLKNEQILKKSLKIIEKNLLLSNSTKMKPRFNVPKVRQTIPVGFLEKQELSKKHLKNKLKPNNKSLRETKKIKQIHNEI